MSKSKIKWGSDPEFFAGYVGEDGKTYVIPPVVFRSELGVEFQENQNHPIFKKYGGTLIHEDGAAFEMSTPPSHNWRSMWNTINEARIKFGEQVLSKFPEHCLPELLSLPTINYEVPRWLKKGPEFHLSTTFGCDPDKDVYNIKARAKVIDARKHGFRYGGGHIHVSGIPEIKESPLLAIRSMVLTAGLAATAYTDVPDLDAGRLFLYGRPGKFRVQNYKSGEVGIEYRTPSNRWTANSQLAENVFTWAEIGIRSLLQGNLLETIAGDVEKPAVDAILSCDQNGAKDILNFISSKI